MVKVCEDVDVWTLSRLYLEDNRLHIPEVYDTILGRIRARDLASMCDLVPLLSRCNPTARAQGCLMQLEAFFKKNATFTDPVKAENAALASFADSERHCRITNRRLDYYYAHPERLAPDMRFWLSGLQGTLEYVIGDFVDFFREIPIRLKVTGGATSTLPRRHAYPYMKLKKRVVCTRGAAAYIGALYRHFGADEPIFLYSDANRVVTVPKSWKTNRTIACEPAGNIPLQLAFDSWIKDRLRRKLGIDLSSQLANQRAAYEGSTCGTLATIDLKSASDTMAYNTVAWLLPDAWFAYLDSLRSKRWVLNGETGAYAKFSSMGNGATFGLETLIFACAIKAVGSKRGLCYGDDIIIETHLVDDLVKLLRFLGFIVNHDKTHTTGPFRESCGSNWFEGVDITPFYVRSAIRTKADRCFLANGMMRISTPDCNVGRYITELILRDKLPPVAVNDDERSGVWVDPHTAWAAGILRWNRAGQHPETKKLVRVPVSKDVGRLGGLLHWHFKAATEKGSNVVPRSNNQETRLYRCTSSVPILGAEATRRAWSYWSPPVEGTPLHLYWWSAHLFHKGK